jgi:hypothetical protein
MQQSTLPILNNMSLTIPNLIQQLKLQQQRHTNILIVPRALLHFGIRKCCEYVTKHPSYNIAKCSKYQY